MKIIETRQLGKVEYLEENIITFNSGLPGFEDEKQFIVCQNDSDSPFAYLQSVNNLDLTFILANPFNFFSDYLFDLDDNVKEELQINKIEDVATWGILSITDDVKNASINLKAPLIINVNIKKGKQYIIHEVNYLTATPLFPQPIREGGI
ncbi:MAG: flagellar assembly protein FliW [Vulcanibacillus sp.]